MDSPTQQSVKNQSTSSQSVANLVSVNSTNLTVPQPPSQLLCQLIEQILLQVAH